MSVIIMRRRECEREGGSWGGRELGREGEGRREKTEGERAAEKEVEKEGGRERRRERARREGGSSVCRSAMLTKRTIQVGGESERGLLLCVNEKEGEKEQCEGIAPPPHHGSSTEDRSSL